MSQNHHKCVHCFESTVNLTVPATKFCTTCNLSLCEKCSEAHANPNSSHIFETIKTMTLVEAQQKWKELKTYFNTWQNQTQCNEDIFKTIPKNYEKRISDMNEELDSYMYRLRDTVEECTKQLQALLAVEKNNQTKTIKQLQDKTKQIKELFTETNPQIIIQNYMKAIELFNELQVMVGKKPIESYGTFKFVKHADFKATIGNTILPMLNFIDAPPPSEITNVTEIVANISLQISSSSSSTPSNTNQQFDMIPTPHMIAFSFKEIQKKRITNTPKSDELMMPGRGVAFSHKHRMVFVAVEYSIYLYNMDTLENVNTMHGHGIEDIEIVSNYDGRGGDGLLVACGPNHTQYGLKLFDVNQIMLMININVSLDGIVSVFHIQAGFSAVCVKYGTNQNKNNNGRGPLIFASQYYNGFTKLLILNSKGEIQKEFEHGNIKGIAVIDDCVLVTDYILGVVSVLQEQNDNGQLDNYIHISTEKFVSIRGPICVDPVSKSIFITEVEKYIHKISVFNLKMGALVFSKQLKLPEGSGNVISHLNIPSEYKIFALDYDPYNGRLWISESALRPNTKGNIVILE